MKAHIKSLSIAFFFFLSLIITSCNKNSAVNTTQDQEEFINYSIDGTQYHYSAPGDTLGHPYHDITESGEFLPGEGVVCNGHDGNYIVLTFGRNGIGLNSQQQFGFFGVMANFGQYNMLRGDAFVYITEYGSVGEFISGNLSALVTETQSPSPSHNLVINFRVRRTY